MTITTYISWTIISLLPLGFLIPETFYKCGQWIWWIYSTETKNIYVCEWDQFTEFYKLHEIWHKIWLEELSEEYKNKYTSLYDQAMKAGSWSFYREYSMINVAEDFADTFAVWILNKRVNQEVRKRVNKIKFYIRKTKLWEQ